MPQGAWNPKREREYEELKREFEEEGRYHGREEEVAARIVNRQRAEQGETKEARQQDRAGRSPDRGLPIVDYDHLTVDEVSRRLDDLDEDEIEDLMAYERDHKHRKTMLARFDRRLSG